MALRLLQRFRPTAIHESISRHLHRPVITSSSHEILDSRHRSYSDASHSTKEETSSSGKAAIADEADDEGNADRVSFKSSLSEPELVKFAAIAETWWDAEGPFKPLHALNPTRIAFIRSTLCDHFGKDPHSIRPFEGLKFVDVGCGGGILSEAYSQRCHIVGFAALSSPLARMGASVTGIDAVEENIKIAKLHAELDPVTSTIEYQCKTAERLVEEQRQFDAVLALEVIEHVADPAEFCKSLAALTVPNGATVISTINRSMRAYATAIVAAEYLLRWLPKGTHEWSKFLTPEELVLILNRASVSVKEMSGFVFNPLNGRWLLSDDISVNFIAFGTKNAKE